MRSSKSQKVLKSFKELKIHLKNRSIPPPDAPAAAGRPALMKPPVQSEQELFHSAMADVTPIRRRNRAQKPLNISLPEQPACNPDREALNQLKNLVCRGDGFVISDTPEYMEGTGHRVPELMTRRLHRGDFSIQAFIDLHGLSVAAAKEAFESFMTTAVQMGKRAVLVIHGRGLSSAAEPVLKTQLYCWLTRGRWRNRVIAFSSARACDGGAGATYVLLRQRPLTKQSRKKPKTNH